MCWESYMQTERGDWGFGVWAWLLVDLAWLYGRWDRIDPIRSRGWTWAAPITSIIIERMLLLRLLLRSSPQHPHAPQ
jgi:hypothetical protein